MKKLEYVSAAGKGGKLVFARLARGCDLIEGLEEISRRHEIKGGCIISCIGALEEAVLHIPSPDGGFAPPVRLSGSIQVLSCQGIIGTSKDSGVHVHLHCTLFRNDEKRIYGGHLLKGENRVSVTMEVVILTVDGVDVSFKMDPTIDEASPTLYLVEKKD